MKSRIAFFVLMGLMLAASFPRAAGDTPAAPDGNYQVLSGSVATDKGEVIVKGKSATLVLGDAGAATYRLTAEVQLAGKGKGKGNAVVILVLPEDAKDFKKPGAMQVGIHPDKTGNALRVTRAHFDAVGKEWSAGKNLAYTYWPAENKKKGTKKADKLASTGLTPRSWHDRWLRLEVDVDRKTVAVWLEGLLVRQYPRPEGSKGAVAVQLAQGDRLRRVKLDALPVGAGYQPIDVTALANDHFAKPIGKDRMEVQGVPFQLAQGQEDNLSLRQAGWRGWQSDLPWSHETAVPAILHDPQMPMLRVPSMDYVAAHVLAVADDDPALAPALTLRAGHYGRGGNDQDVQYDFLAQVPRRGQVKEVKPEQVVSTPAGPLFYVRVPLDVAFAQDIDSSIDIELTKEVRVARRKPDPNRFRYRPLGLPSGVHIAAITLERSPLQMQVSSKETGHAFVEPQKPTFQVALKNITAGEQEYTLTVQATHLGGSTTEARQSGRVKADSTVELSVPVPTSKRGYHDLVVALDGADKKPLLRRHTSFALLPPDTRKHRAQSPFGTYDFGGSHYTLSDPDKKGPLFVKLGMRYGFFGGTPEALRKFGLLKGNEPKATSVQAYEAALAKYPDLPPSVLLFHETSISGRHVTRVPDLFHDRPPYQLNEKEQKRYETLLKNAIQTAKEFRQKYPKVHIRFGNGPMPTKEEFFRRKLPAELFDSAGNESGSFGSLPETQPPDYLANNASLWMDRQLLDAYGYKDKPVTMCHEVCYPSTNAGNLDTRTQADYLVRHALHALAWGIPEFRPGTLTDVGGNYRLSHWGSSGFLRARPEVNVKPAFVAFATMTLVLDGAKFVRDVPLGSASLYGMEFARPDGSQAFVLWTVRGRRSVGLRLENADAWKCIDDQGNEKALKASSGIVEATVSPSAIYLVGKGRLMAAVPGQPVYTDKPAGKATLLAPLANLDGWDLEKERDAELEFYSFMIPRRKGDFAFEPVAGFEGRQQVLRVTPRPIKSGKDTMPMYAVLAHKKGIPVPGTPTEVGLWVNGNSAWGRVMFELHDASGQRWISIGAQQHKTPTSPTFSDNPWVDNGIPKELLAKFPNPGINDWSTDDNYGHSRINFDGWRYVAMPLPGNYPGEGYSWPATSQWRWDKDGVVHYPLTFKRLIVELPEKTLHLKTFAPVARLEVYLKDLTVGQGDTALVKRTAIE